MIEMTTMLMIFQIQKRKYLVILTTLTTADPKNLRTEQSAFVNNTKVPHQTKTSSEL